jgi:3-deoxy-7-phosphoheptulonate synthase
MLESTDDRSIAGYSPLISAAVLMEELPTSEIASQTVARARTQAKTIIDGSDDRLMVVTGPCSIHDTTAALEYGSRLKTLASAYRDELLVIMRVYFEKPRTTVGWKGLINDPGLDDTFDVNKGLRLARGLLLDLADEEIPAGSEFLDVITPQFIADLISWGAIGARTTESQIHRELASGSSMPIGFKNRTDGNVQVAVDAIGAARHPHHFLSITKHGLAAIVETTGNKHCHIILRGSNSGPNYDQNSVAQTAHLLKDAGLSSRIMIDASHGNSRKNHLAQSTVVDDICTQVSEGSHEIFGVMIESHLEEGKQSHSNLNSLKYGQSITDACISWTQTEPLLERLANAVLKKGKNPR